MELKQRLARHVNVYRVIAAAGFLAVVVMVMVIPARMSGASPWAYYYGVKNFSHGKLVIDDRTLFQQMREAGQKGGMLIQYVKIGMNKWALEKAPGYVFYLVPFEWLGIPRWGNILLTAGMVVVTYLLLKRIRDEKTACIGSLLMLFTPIGLIMLNRAYMDTFASLAFLAMGGGLYFYYLMEGEKWSWVRGGAVLFTAFLLISWSVVTRYSNLPIAVIIALHFAVIRSNAFLKGDRAWLRPEIPAVVLGIGLPIAALLLYNYFVFGSPLDYGYKYTPFPVKFAYEYLGQVNASGQSIPLKIIVDNLKTVPQALLQGFPLLVIGIPGAVVVLWQKFSRAKSSPAGWWAGLHTELSWGFLLVFAGWFLSVYVLYMTYEFTAEYLKSGSSFFRYSRYYLPGLFPVAIASALIVSRLPWKVSLPVMLVILVAGTVLYFQVALNLNA
ncbi:MAG: hypothetical protein A2Y90_03580 [Chloroflexi bacterium RBG_13_52_12]|nr:MAG: hypothetical protein A2Y90_03580 [Chloroflexi bacterium RBG_13_52_12]